MKALVAFLVSRALLAQAPPKDAWPTYNGDYSGRRYSTLSKINQSNINSLSLAWVNRGHALFALHRTGEYLPARVAGFSESH